jgi:hypothetical protein
VTPDRFCCPMDCASSMPSAYVTLDTSGAPAVGDDSAKYMTSGVCTA